jgi:hypothetical protein
MRIWTLNLSVLDRARLLGLWRESLLCAKGIKYLMRGEKFPYTSHPQSLMIQSHKQPIRAINTYLYYIYEEACKRGYKFDTTKIDYDLVGVDECIKVPIGQVEFEYRHLSKKLDKEVTNQGVNGLFEIVEGNIWKYEKI